MAKRDKSLGWIHTFGFEECRSVKEISTAIRFMAAATREVEPELGVLTCSLDAKQAFHTVPPENLSLLFDGHRSCVGWLLEGANWWQI